MRVQVGAWLGAVPIPLDWDRDWQAWPVTIVTGAYLGWWVFRLAGEFLLHGKRISFEEDHQDSPVPISNGHDSEAKVPE